MTDRVDHEATELAEIEEFERLGRQAGAELRAPAPEDGAGAIEQTVVRRRRVGAIGGGVVLIVVVVGGLIVATRGEDEDPPPATVAPTLATTTTLPPPAALELSGHSGLVDAIDVSPDGRFVVSAGDLQDGTIRLWDAMSGAELWQAPVGAGGPSGVSQIAFNPAGTTIAVGYGDESTMYLDVADGRPGVAFPPPWTDEPALTPLPREVLSPDGRTAVVLERFTGARLVDATTHETIRSLGSSGTAYVAAFRDDGQYVAVKFDDIVRVWRLDPLEQVASFDLPAYEATAERLEFTPDGTRIAYTVEDAVFIQRFDPSP